MSIQIMDTIHNSSPCRAAMELATSWANRLEGDLIKKMLDACRAALSHLQHPGRSWHRPGTSRIATRP